MKFHFIRTLNEKTDVKKSYQIKISNVRISSGFRTAKLIRLSGGLKNNRGCLN